jgi:hypothetical protein
VYLGDIRLGDTIDFGFTTTDTTGAPTTLAGTPVVSAYPGNSTTELTAGITLSVDFDSRTGMHNVRIVATSGNGYATATDYKVVITTGTVGGTSVVGYVIAHFSIEKRSALMPTTAARTAAIDANGRVDVGAVLGTAQTAGDLKASLNTLQSDTDDIQTRLPAALVGGRMDSSVGAMASAVLTAAAIAADAITAAKIADGAIDRATFAADTGLQTVRSGTAQAGAAGTITLDASASATTDYYVGCPVYLTGATGAGQVRVITAYNGTTKVASVDRNWATNPDNTSTFAVLPLAAPKLNAALEVISASLTAAPSDSSGVTTLLARLTSGRATNLDNLDAAVSSRMATFTLPTNFSSLVIDANGRVDLSKWLGATVNALISGRVDANTQALAAGVIATASFAANAIDTTVVKADAKESIADTLLNRNVAGGSNTGRTREVGALHASRTA